MSRTCVVNFSLQGQLYSHVTEAPSLFQAGANALEWFEVTCKTFGTAIRVPDDAVLTVGLVGNEARYHVRAGRVRAGARR